MKQHERDEALARSLSLPPNLESNSKHGSRRVHYTKLHRFPMTARDSTHKGLSRTNDMQPKHSHLSMPEGATFPTKSVDESNKEANCQQQRPLACSHNTSTNEPSKQATKAYASYNASTCHLPDRFSRPKPSKGATCQQ
ncbi:hypothetical protein LTS10_011014 [Elasticomyces elasticus]|nr:hypothetical protein LTS10_011014 [Elasticomyces elasticus]